MTFEHYIITRFNLSHFEGVGQGRLDEEYLDYRFSLFESYCLPSVINQDCQDFKWIILFDAKTPDKYKQRISELHSAYNNIVPFFFDSDIYKDVPEAYIRLNDDYEKRIIHYFPDKRDELVRERISRLSVPRFVNDCIKSLSENVPDFYLTTRLDSDDSLRNDFVRRVQEKARENPRRYVIDFPNTYKYIQDEGIAYVYQLENNHFITLMEPASGTFQSVIYWNHLYARIFVEVEHHYEEPMQMELIHSGNVVNAFTEISTRGLIYGKRHFKTRRFGLKDIRFRTGRFLYVTGSVIKGRLKNKDFVRKYIWPLPRFRREVVAMVDGTGHGGLTDRLRNALSVYSYCKTHGERFRLYYSHPCDLRQILEPNKYDWSIDNKDLTFSVYDSKELKLTVDVLGTTHYSRAQIHDINARHWLHQLSSALKGNKHTQFHVHGNSYLAEGHQAALFAELFNPTALLQQRLDAVRSSLPAEYEAVTLRFQNLLGDFKEYGYMPLPENEQECLITICLDKIEELYAEGYFSTKQLLVTTDSSTFLERASRLTYVHTIPGRLAHIDNIVGDGLEESLKSFTDLLMLSQSSRVTLLQTGRMYRSGFPKFAAELGGVEFRLVEF